MKSEPDSAQNKERRKERDFSSLRSFFAIADFCRQDYFRVICYLFRR
jgi:hypothetical protein